ncbi:MAG: HD domain-containing phosphohydrolase, partial [Pseudomonadota bacterium]|nr:HD domain-containing phosphohydrolase [Pseudomonadota bacterium]
MRDTFARIRAGRTIELGTFEELVGDIVSTAGHCPRTLIETIRLKHKDEYTHLHSVAVATLMVNVARQLGRSEREVYEYGLAGLFHDIGKVRVDDAILGKEGSLSAEEFDLVRAHPQDGFDILRATPGLPDAALDVCLHHHERPDGKGYPFG